MHGVCSPNHWIFEKPLISGISCISVILCLKMHFDINVTDYLANAVFLHTPGFDISFQLNMYHDSFGF